MCFSTHSYESDRSKERWNIPNLYVKVISVKNEEVVYPKVRPFYGQDNTQELYDEQAQMKRVLDQIKAISPSSSEFKDQVKQLMEAVGDHIGQEESTMFAAIRNNLNTEQSEQLATEFKAAKTRIQQKLGVVNEANV